MELSGALRRLAAGRPHALLAVAPGGTAARLAVERELRERGWPEAASPADADLLVVCGRPGGDLADAVDRVWAQLPSPRVRLEISGPEDATRALDSAQELLAARSEPRRGLRPPAKPTGGHGGGHSQHGNGDGEEMRIAGLPLADRAPDRDGLKLDRLELPLGPVLTDWPAGLVLTTQIQGDVIQEAEVDVVGEESAEPFWSEPWLRASDGEPVTAGEAARRRAARRLDSLGRLLMVAGDERGALVARIARDRLVAGSDAAAVEEELTRVGRTLRGSRLLRWAWNGLGTIPAELAAELGVGGDVHARALRWLDEAEAAVASLGDEDELGGAADDPAGRARALLDALPQLVAGVELGEARLIVASLDPDVDELGAIPAVRHG